MDRKEKSSSNAHLWTETGINDGTSDPSIVIFQPDVGVQPELEGFRQDPQISNDVMDFVTEIAETTTAINEYDNGEII